MSQLMEDAVLNMPYELAMSDELSRHQFYQRAQAARQADTVLIQQALYVIEAWERGCEAEDYWRDRHDTITSLRERLMVKE